MATRNGQGRKALPFIIVAAFLAVLITPAAGAAQDGQWQFGSTPSFSSGKYGTDTRTDVLYTPITARRTFDDGDVTFVFPFTCIWGNGSVTLVNGLAARHGTDRQQRRDRRQQRPRTTTTSPSTTISPGTSGSSASGRSCGMGDIVVRGRYFFLDEHGWVPTIAVRAHVKRRRQAPNGGLAPAGQMKGLE